MRATTAAREGGDYLINGVKWLITGAEVASYAIVSFPGRAHSRGRPLSSTAT